MKIVPSPSENSQSTQELFEIDLESLGEIDCEAMPIASRPSRHSGSFQVWEDEVFILAFASVRVDETTIESVSLSLYRELFALIGDRILYRIWNYSPRINEGEGDREMYKMFCKGRSEAFHERFGSEEETFMPAGSCVGIDGDRLVVYFLAGSVEPAHHENPKQVPAYRYPRKYGVKSPSFARATSLITDGRFFRFISGTASVVGHESLGVGDIAAQLETTCDNLELIAAEAAKAVSDKLVGDLAVSGKVYLRDPSAFSQVRDYLETRMSHWNPSLVFVHSDICRKELLVEIELTFEQSLA